MLVLPYYKYIFIFVPQFTFARVSMGPVSPTAVSVLLRCYGIISNYNNIII